MSNNQTLIAIFLLLGLIVIVVRVISRTPTSEFLDIVTSSQDVETISRHIPPRKKEESFQLIPRVIIQTNDDIAVPIRMKNAMATIIDNNPEYTYRYFTDADRYEFISSQFNGDVLRAYKKIIPGAFKADLFRYCYLYINGGIYIDSSMVCVSPLKNVIKPTDVFIASEDNRSGNVYNAILMCAPYSPLLDKAIKHSTAMILSEQYGKNMLDITGPGCLRDCFKQLISDKVTHNTDYGAGIRLLSHTWYPSQHNGMITDGDNIILRTKYPGYKDDKVWYNKIKNYATLWEEHNIYHRDI